MTAPDKSFFSGLHLVVTTVAALITATVAVLGLALSQGWLGGGTSNSNPGGATTVAAPQYAVDPSSVSFQPLGPTTVPVKVSNTGVVPLAVDPPTLTGPDTSRFTASVGTCTAPVAPGRSCQIQLTFKPAPGTFTATLVIQGKGTLQATEVPIQATAIL